MMGRVGCIREERGVAMITVIVLAVVLMILGSGMFFVAGRENRITQADYVGSQAFYFAEGGIENVINMLNFAATEQQLTQLRPDQSLDDGHGYLMDPIESQREDPPNPLEIKIGDTPFTVWVDEVNADGSHCIGSNCSLNLQTANPAYLLITAEGESSEGYRKLQQRVKLEASGFPMTLFIRGNVKANGNVALTNQSLYVLGDLKGREKLTVSGEDLVNGGDAAVFATGTIYEKQNGSCPIYDDETGAPIVACWDANYINDRDGNGLIVGLDDYRFTVDQMNSMYETAGLTSAQLLTLKSMAKTSGYYANPESGNITLQNDNPIPTRDGNIVVYIEYSGGTPEGNQVNLKFDWPHSPYTNGQAIVVIKNGSVKMTGSQMGYFNGYVYCPDGSAQVDGTGSGMYTGFLYAKGLDDIGNFNFNMTSSFLTDPPFFAWTVVRETAWTEMDR